MGVVWSVNGVDGGNSSIGTIDATGKYTSPSGTKSLAVTIRVTSNSFPKKVAAATVYAISNGQVAATNNAQVAQYTISLPASVKVFVQFGTDTNYGLTTWSQPAPQNGGAVSLFVAGMRANTLYHMRGVVQFPEGMQLMDADQTFMTGAPLAAQLPNLTTTTTAGMTPQSGVELLSFVNTTPTSKLGLAVADLSGNVLWTYNPGLPLGIIANPIKLMPNGHFLINFSKGSLAGVNSVLQEVDLAGNLIWQMTAADLNNALAAATCAGCNIMVLGTHHDFAILPNGHLIVIASTHRVVSGVTVIGDVLIDLDQNRKPQWAWNEFDHLDINRRPYQYPDWTHTNAILYSAADGNLIISIRHQNWLVKVDYANGAGTGDILWRLGYQGDFTLVGGADPTNWFYAQHGPSFMTANTAGKFSLILFDNGDDRVFAPGVNCDAPGQPPCFYSATPILQLDESAKTATLPFNRTAPLYSFFGGNAEVLGNGNLEFTESATTDPANNAAVYEFTQGPNAQIVWQMQIAGQYAYRGMRMPSFYPGVQW